MKKTLLSRITLTCLGLMASMLTFATQYCQHPLTNGSNTINISCESTGTDQYQILIEGTGLAGLGGSFCHINGTEAIDLRTAAVVAADGTSITITLNSTSEPDIYTPLFVMMPGEVNFGSIAGITWGTCGAASDDEVAPVMGTASLVGTPTYNSAVIAVTATDDVTNPVTTFVVNDPTNGINNRQVTAVNGEITLTALSKNTTYTLEISAKDAANNVSANNATVSFTTDDRQSDCQGSVGHFGNPTVKKVNYQISYQGGAITYTVTPFEIGDSIDFCEIQTTNGSFPATIANNEATYTQMGVTEGTEMAIRIMYSLTNMPGNEMSSENIALTDPNIIYYVAGDCSTGVVIPTAPTTAAPTPRIFAAGKTITIFSDVNNQLAGIDYNPFWGQSTLVTFDTIDNNNTMKYANFNYQGTDFGFDINAVSMDSLHIDLWSETAFSLNLFPICRTQAQGEKSFTITVTAGEWNSIDIPVSYFTNLGLDMSGIFQLKMDGGAGQTFYIDNIYFYTISVDVDSEIPTDFTAVPGTITHNSIELILNAADNSGSINYTIINGLDTMHTAGVSETDKSFIVRNLEESTAYTFYVIAADATGNSTDTITVSVSTIAGPAKPTTAAPAPTAAQEDVISIYSNHYDAATTFAFGSWGQSTIASFYNIDEEEMIKLEEFNYLGLELNGNEANFDASEMTHLHIDVWTPNGTSFQITPIWGSEAIYTCTPLETETWNSFDIALTNFASIDLTNIYQIKLVGNGTHYLDNIYFYKANETSLEEVTSNVTVYSKNGTLYLNDINGETVTIFTTTGQCIYMNQQVDNTLQVNLEKGIYLVRVGTKTMKVVL